MFKTINDWIVQQVPPLVLLLLALVGWAGALVFTPARLTTLEAQQAKLAAQVATGDTVSTRRLASLELVTTNLVKRACWESDAQWRLWLGCDAVLGNQVPGGRR